MAFTCLRCRVTDGHDPYCPIGAFKRGGSRDGTPAARRGPGSTALRALSDGRERGRRDCGRARMILAFVLGLTLGIVGPVLVKQWKGGMI